MRRIQENNLFIYRLLNATGRESDNQSPNLQWADAPVCGSPNAENVHAYGRLYVYDKMGNIQSLQQTGTNAFTRLYEYENGKNTLAEITDNDSPPNTLCAFSYDACGNMTQSNTERFYQWDAADQLKSFHIQAGTSEPSIYAQYLYDAAGNRTKKIVRTAGGNYEVTVYIDGVFEYCKKVSGSTYEKNYCHIMDGAQRIAQQRVGSFSGDIDDEVIYILGDFLGSSNVRLNSSGGLIDREEYYPFGDSSLRTFSSKRYRYVGKEKDQESGLYYYGARYYASWTCRFISVDPLAGKYNQLTPYQNAGNNPINDWDIDGQQGESTETAGDDGKASSDYGHVGTPALDSEGQLFNIPEVTIKTDGIAEPSSETKRTFWQNVGGFIKEHIVDNIPVVSGLVSSVEAIAKGDWVSAGIGIGEALLDATLLITTGGIGNLLKAGTKSGLKFATKIIAKETGENLAQSEVSEAISGATGKELPLWAQVAIGVTIGIKPGDTKSGIKKGGNKTGDAAKTITKFTDRISKTSLKGSNFNVGRRRLTNAGAVYSGQTETGRHIFKDSKGRIVVAYDPLSQMVADTGISGVMMIMVKDIH